MEVHLEMVSDRLAEPLFDQLAGFPPGALHLELGLQSLDAGVLAAIDRRMDVTGSLAHLRRLRQGSAATLHVDLIAGLPGETVASLAAGFNRLWEIRPQEIQLGILKRLPGTPLADRTRDPAWVFNPRPPYEILANPWLDFPCLQRIKRLARYLEILHNHGRFPRGLDLLCAGTSAFGAWMDLADRLWAATGQTHGLALERQIGLLQTHLCAERGLPAQQVRQALTADVLDRGRGAELPPCLRRT